MPHHLKNRVVPPRRRLHNGVGGAVALDELLQGLEKPCYHPWQREWVEIRENSTGPRGKRTEHPEKADRNQPRLHKFGPIPVRELPQKAQRESTQISEIWAASRVGILTRKAPPEAKQKEEN